MPTPTEKRALGFFAGILLLGAGVRAVAAAGGSPPSADARSRVELHRQIESVDSARRAGGGKKGRRRPRAGADTTDRRRSTAAGSVWEEETTPPRVYYLRERPRRAERPATESGPAPGPAPRKGRPDQPVVDVDQASAAELEQLPRVGPALAKRIVAEREANGPFGSLEELMRVRGIGPGIARTIAPYVTFTGSPRLSGESGRVSGAAGGPGRRLRKPRSP
jgi:competence protein ComEA